jgi:trigger factor
MKLTISPAAQSSVQLEIELPPEKLNEALLDAVRRLSRRTRVPGFRPGKAPRIMLERVLGPESVIDEAVEHLVSDSYREAMLGIQVIPLDQPAINFPNQPKEGEPVAFTATVQVRPSVRLGDYKNFNFRPEIETIDDEKVDKVMGELRDQNALLEPVEDRAVAKDDYVVIAFEGTRNGEPYEGGSSDRMPLIVGGDRLIPGFEDNLIGLKVGDKHSFDITFPDDYAEPSLAGQVSHFDVEIKEHRAKVLPELNDDFARELGPYEDLAALRVEIRHRLERNALDKARHEFADKIIEYAVANATLELPDAVAGPNHDAQGLPRILVEQETEVMHDEFRSTLARQGITDEAYAKVTGQTHEELHNEFRPQAEKRVLVLLVLSKVAEVQGVTVPDADVEAEVGRARKRYGDNKKLLSYFDSERGRNFIRSTLRRSRTVEGLVDEWLVAHPEHPHLPHADDDDQRSMVSSASAEASASVEVTDPGSLGESDESDGTDATETTSTTESAPEGATASSGRSAQAR